jgi:hypothetical protein
MKLTRILLVLLAVFFIASIPLNRKTNSHDAQAQPSPALSPGAQAVVPPPAGQSDPPGTIDGSKNPELIPDTVAYRLVLLAIAEPENATDAQQARFRAKISSAHLIEDDIQILLGILGPFQNQMDALTAQANQILARDPLPFAGTPDYQSLTGLSRQRETIFNQAMSALPARLSADGAARLQAYVESAKRGMKYLPSDDFTP